MEMWLLGAGIIIVTVLVLINVYHNGKIKGVKETEKMYKKHVANVEEMCQGHISELHKIYEKYDK